MTREDANNKFYVTFQNGARDAQPGSYNWCQSLIAALESVGVLKLDDPAAKMRDNAALVLEGRRYDGAFITGTAACQMIDSLLINGFKITR